MSLLRQVAEIRSVLEATTLKTSEKVASQLLKAAEKIIKPTFSGVSTSAFRYGFSTLSFVYGVGHNHYDIEASVYVAPEGRPDLKNQFKITATKRVYAPGVFTSKSATMLKQWLPNDEKTAMAAVKEAAKLAMKDAIATREADQVTWNATPAIPSGITLASITSRLQSMKLGPGGKVRSVDEEGSGWTVEPMNRQRLDHFGSSEDDEEGWDDEGWEEEYAGPVRAAAAKWLETEFGPGLFMVEVGEKGHVDIELTPAGKAKFGKTN